MIRLQNICEQYLDPTLILRNSRAESMRERERERKRERDREREA
jgi:hypothetical protein